LALLCTKIENQQALVINNSPIFNNSNINNNDISISIGINLNNVFESINESQLSDDNKASLKLMIEEIDNMKKNKNNKTLIWEKVKRIFYWIANKTVDITLAATLVPFLTSAII
jgi:hypothetical protein